MQLTHRAALLYAEKYPLPFTTSFDGPFGLPQFPTKTVEGSQSVQVKTHGGRATYQLSSLASVLRSHRKRVPSVRFPWKTTQKRVTSINDTRAIWQQLGGEDVSHNQNLV